MYCMFPLPSTFVFHPSPHLHPLSPNSPCGQCLLFVVSATLNKNFILYSYSYSYSLQPVILDIVVNLTGWFWFSVRNRNVKNAWKEGRLGHSWCDSAIIRPVNCQSMTTLLALWKQFDQGKQFNFLWKITSLPVVMAYLNTGRFYAKVESVLRFL